MYLVGKPDYQPLIGRAEGIAAAAGLTAGDRLLAVDGQPTPTWTDAVFALTQAALERAPVTVEWERPSGTPLQRRMPLDQLPADLDPSRILHTIGLTPHQFLLPAVSGTHAADRAAPD